MTTVNTLINNYVEMLNAQELEHADMLSALGALAIEFMKEERSEKDVETFVKVITAETTHDFTEEDVQGAIERAKSSETTEAEGTFQPTEEGSLFTACSTIAAISSVAAVGILHCSEGLNIAGVVGGVAGTVGAYFAGSKIESMYGRNLKTQGGSVLVGLAIGGVSAKLGGKLGDAISAPENEIADNGVGEIEHVELAI